MYKLTYRINEDPVILEEYESYTECINKVQELMILFLSAKSFEVKIIAPDDHVVQSAGKQ